MLTIDALKKLAVSYGYAPSVEAIDADNIADVINMMAEANFCTVTFSASPEETEIVVKKGTDVVNPIDGAYKLIKGSYTYTATAEGYTAQTDVSLSITAGDVTSGTKTVTVTMVPEE